MSNAIATNTSANSAVSYLSRNSDMQAASSGKLSSGSRIVKASDDAASLAVGTKLKADVTALKQAGNNASQASSMLQVADGALANISDTLVRMKSLATQANSDVLSDTERGYLNEEFTEMQDQVDFIVSSTKFNDVAVLDGTFESDEAVFQVGVTAGDGAGGSNDEIAIEIKNASLAELDSATGTIDADAIDTKENAAKASANLDAAIEDINTRRATLGSQMSRFEKISENIATTSENLDAARSTLMDVDVAAEMSEFSKNQVMTQAATAMLAQANQLPQNLMRLMQ
ncbi:MAG: flagellin [Alphaproteobacteria bacterium]